MKIDGIGELHMHEDIDEWLTCSPIETPFFPGVSLRLIFTGTEGDAHPEDFAETARNLLRLTSKDREQAESYVFKHYQSIVNAFCEEGSVVNIQSAAEVWNHVKPTEIFITRRVYGDKKVYAQVTLECAWEPEHGLQIVYREGKTLARVSSQDGHLTHSDAYDLPESEDRILDL